MTFFSFLLFSNFLALFNIKHSLFLSLRFCIISFLFHFSFQFCCLLFPLGLSFTRFLFIIVINNFLAILISPIEIGLILFFSLFLEELLNSSFFQFLCIESLLNLKLVDLHFSVSSFSFFSCELIIILCFFNLVHCSCIREVLNLARWNTFLFFLSFDCILDAYTLFNT